MIKQKISNNKHLEKLCYNESLSTPQTYLSLIYNSNKKNKYKQCKSFTIDGCVARKITHWSFLPATYYFLNSE